MAKIEYNIPGTECRICILEGSVLKQEGLKIIHCPRTFDTSDEIVPAHSVYGQFLKVCSDKNVNVDNQIDTFCRIYSNRGITSQARKFRKILFEVGELCPVMVDDEQFCIAAFSITDSIFSAESIELSDYLVYWQNIWHNLTNLTIYREVVNVAVPGDRLVNISSNHFTLQQKVAVIVNSFLQHINSSGITKQLNICLYGRDADNFDYEGWTKTLFPFLAEMAQLPYSISVRKHALKPQTLTFVNESSKEPNHNNINILYLFVNDLKEMIKNIENHLGEEYIQFEGSRKTTIVIDADIMAINEFIEALEHDESMISFFAVRRGVKYDRNRMFQLLGVLQECTKLFGNLNRRSVMKIALDANDEIPERWHHLGNNIDNVINYVGQKLADLKRDKLVVYNNIKRMVPVKYRK